jgi:RpiR family carbohydrate utilization transcriptional regulator
MNSQAGIILKMQALVKNMSKAEQKVISYILSRPEQVIHLSVTGLAENSGVSDATVVRTCRKIGMSGYQDLKVTLAQSLISPLKSIHEEINAGDSPTVVVQKVFESTIHTLNYTQDVVDVRTIEQAAKLLQDATRVIIFGVGNSHSVVIDMQHKLMRLGINATGFTDSHMQVIAAAVVTPDTIVVGISNSGSSIDVVEAVKTCKIKGCKIISLTSFGRSPLSKISDVNLVTASRETEYRVIALSSRVAQMVIIDCIYTLIALDKKDEALANFLKIDEGMRSKKF